MDVLDALVQGRNAIDPVRRSGTALVELEDAQVLGMVLSGPPEDLLFPTELGVGDQGWNENDVRPGSLALVRDVQVAALGELDVGDVHASRPGASRNVAGGRFGIVALRRD